MRPSRLDGSVIPNESNIRTVKMRGAGCPKSPPIVQSHVNDAVKERAPVAVYYYAVDDMVVAIVGSHSQ